MSEKLPLPRADAKVLGEGALRMAKDFIMSTNNTTGYCMCGSRVEDHGYGDGHSPVDEGSYRASQVVECVDEALAALSTPIKKATPDA